MKQLRAIWAYRFFIISTIKTEFRSRFVRSKLGGLWMILHPLAQVAIYALVLSAVLKAKLPNIDNQYAYAIYLMAGTVGWNFFNDIFGRSVNIFIENGNLIKKMAFPKITLPLIVTGSALVNNVLLFLAVLTVFGLLGHVPSIHLLWLPLLLLVIASFALGLGLMLGIINVFVRDIGQIVPIVMQFWFWLTPIVYVSNALPKDYQELLYINPMTGIITNFQNIMVYNLPINFEVLYYPMSISIVSIALALFLYFKSNEEMADAL